MQGSVLRVWGLGLGFRLELSQVSSARVPGLVQARVSGLDQGSRFNLAGLV
jgi:hypothetical protein